MKKLSSLEASTDGIIERTLEEGARAALPHVKRALHDVIGSGLISHKGESRSTGELEGSLGISPVDRDKDFNYNVKIGFSEPRRDGQSNALIASVIEYGKHGQPPKPFIKRARGAAKRSCEAAMKRKFEEEISKL